MDNGDESQEAINNEENYYNETVDDILAYIENNASSAEVIVNDVMISSASLDLQVRETIRRFDSAIRWYWLNRNDNNNRSDEIDTISALYSLDDDQYYMAGPSGNRALAGALLAPLFLTTGKSHDHRPELDDAVIQQLPAEPPGTPPADTCSITWPVQSTAGRNCGPQITESFQETLRQQSPLAETASPRFPTQLFQQQQKLLLRLNVGGDEPVIWSFYSRIPWRSSCIFIHALNLYLPQLV